MCKVKPLTSQAHVLCTISLWERFIHANNSYMVFTRQTLESTLSMSKDHDWFHSSCSSSFRLPTQVWLFENGYDYNFYKPFIPKRSIHFYLSDPSTVFAVREEEQAEYRTKVISFPITFPRVSYENLSHRISKSNLWSPELHFSIL